MPKNKYCPDAKVCNFNCESCAHNALYNSLTSKVELQGQSIIDLLSLNKILSQAINANTKPPANWWYITFTDKNGDVQPHRHMDPEERKRIGAAVAAGAVCGVIIDKEDQK